MRKNFATLATVLSTSLWLSGCLTIGKDFPVEPVSQLEIGVTRKAEVQELFGDPWRMGIEDGEHRWTYGVYRYSLFGETQARDLVVRFDPSGVVNSYSFNSSDPADAGRAEP